VQGDEQVLELLNEALTGELTAINQFLDEKAFDGWGYVHLGNRGLASSAEWADDGRELLENRETQSATIGQIGEAHHLAQQIRG
jgi:bacterioferritin (cytochrome b1)